MELPVINAEGQQGEPLQVSDTAFGVKFNEALIHQVVLPQLVVKCFAAHGTPLICVRVSRIFQQLNYGLDLLITQIYYFYLLNSN